MESVGEFIAGNWPLMAASAGSVLLAAFCAGAETAIVFSNKTTMREMADAGNRRAGAVIELAEDRDRLHIALLLVENCLIILAAVLSTVLAIRAVQGSLLAAVLATAVVSACVVFFAKLIPKGIAYRTPEAFALAVAPAFHAVEKTLWPLTRLLAKTADAVTGSSPQGLSCAAVVTEEDIKAMINLGEERGSLKEEEKELLHKVFEFGDTLASEAMRPRTEIVSVPSDAVLKDVFSLVSEHGYSRYPVIEATVDTVIGILYVKDILVAMSAGEVNPADGIERFIRPAYFIPENKRVSELLSEMQRQRFQLAIVIDEYGGTAGLVTLEDLIEEIVGSIHDELESEQKDVEIMDEKNFVVSGQSPLDEVNELIGTSLQSTDFNTLGGFVFGLFGRMPKVGEQLKYRQLKLEVLELEGRKITKVKITKL
ncbi:MAG TPA: hemolysin family protein [Nitrospirota bacterium]|nr:hemolysin family protein [Nitrospirota bacterium]